MKPEKRYYEATVEINGDRFEVWIPAPSFNDAFLFAVQHYGSRGVVAAVREEPRA